MHATLQLDNDTLSHNLLSLSFDGKRLSVDESYEFCRRVTYSFAKTFYFASHFLPKDKRKACYAIYAFCRFVDEITDHAEQLAKEDYSEAVEVALNQWSMNLESVYSSGLSSNDTIAHPVMIAWADLLKQYSISPQLPQELIEGCLMDTYITRYATFDELYTYCYKVASVVGLMTSEVFGYASKSALPHAIDLGIAMQLTNIARDVAEDAERGRIYLPLDELSMFGISESDIFSKEYTADLEYYMRFFVQRANRYYESANIGIALLDRDSRLTVQLMSTNYRRILSKIAKRDFDPFAGRARLSFFEKCTGIWLAYQEMPRS